MVRKVWSHKLGWLELSNAPDLSTCSECGARIESNPPDGFTEYARQVAGYLDHFAEAHPDHDLLDAPEAHL